MGEFFEIRDADVEQLEDGEFRPSENGIVFSASNTENEKADRERLATVLSIVTATRQVETGFYRKVDGVWEPLETADSADGWTYDVGDEVVRDDSVQLHVPGVGNVAENKTVYTVEEVFEDTARGERLYYLSYQEGGEQQHQFYAATVLNENFEPAPSHE